ncbi:hypothetical protein Ate01nite_53500 [Actinoplanes teichomyceticus]|nr:hypothetical protein Ate01nite_53500 [Actinoplanes teichomyceticus]
MTLSVVALAGAGPSGSLATGPSIALDDRRESGDGRTRRGGSIGAYVPMHVQKLPRILPDRPRRC